MDTPAHLKESLKLMTSCFYGQMVHDLTELAKVFDGADPHSELFEVFATRVERAASQFAGAHHMYRQMRDLHDRTPEEP